MEYPEPAERKQRPELDRTRPARLFSYAKEKQEWVRSVVNDKQHLPEAIDHLIEELELFRIEMFEGESPLLTVVARDVYYTPTIGSNGYRHVIENEPLPMVGDADIYKEHTLQGELFGFHKGINNELRVYMSLGDKERRFMGGIYTPLLSIGLDHANIELVKYSSSEKLQELSEHIDAQLSSYDKDTAIYAKGIIDILNTENMPAVKKLHAVSPIVPEIARNADVSPQFVDALIDIICLKLELYIPHDIQTLSHRVIMTERPIQSYKAGGPALFEDIVPQMGLSGESANRWLGLFFIKDEKAVQIPVQYITNIYKSN